MELLSIDKSRFKELKEELNSNEELVGRLKQNPEKVLKEFSQPNPLESDKWIYRIIVIALGTTILATIIGVLILIGNGKIDDDNSVPTILTAIGSAAIGALAGLLAPPPKKG
ncbi:MAG: hypothetical protein IH597_12725 [Bacteroidales bacterium]|nr:hypothetical protein [Bacteroidales bacterium]